MKTDNQPKHTQGEWRLDKTKDKFQDETWVRDKDGRPIAKCDFIQRRQPKMGEYEIVGNTKAICEANAQRIVKAVNVLSRIEKEIATLEGHVETKYISSNGIILLAIYRELLTQSEGK